ncbi:tellurite resistance protein [Cupriavidus sp. YR651]|uniref:SLAC1 anion channel family protein n=1 Tax=Cupriavidus sp. YR651 TaxID=1855315 RepID=UPI0008817EFD|nr:SLAC1 anion channel family protein [Cupriavidus sp. YR651]SDC99837.1 tellurite resistance protein [Cupriavidus sp. YR651]
MQTVPPPIERSIEEREISVKHLPVNLFASVMGISGLALAWRLAAHQYGVSPVVSGVIGLVAVIAFLILAISYTVKLAKYPNAVMHEFRHPIAGNFFGTVPIAVLLISSIIGEADHGVAEVVWAIGAIGTIALSFTIFSRLFQGKIDSGHALPAWLIPGVATLDIPVAGGAMRMPWAHELNIFSLAVGTILALVFFTMIVSRLIHHEKLASNMIPSLMILIAPFEVGFLAYTNFMQRIDVFAAVLFYFGLFLFFTLVLKVFRRSIPFTAGWWGVSFPIAALSNAALKYADTVRLWPITVLAILLLAFLNVVIVMLFIRTMRTVFNGDLLSGR